MYDDLCRKMSSDPLKMATDRMEFYGYLFFATRRTIFHLFASILSPATSQNIYYTVLPRIDRFSSLKHLYGPIFYHIIHLVIFLLHVTLCEVWPERT